MNSGNCEAVLSELASWQPGEAPEALLARSPLLRSLWRGRMGQDEEEQRETHKSACSASCGGCSH